MSSVQLRSIYDKLMILPFGQSVKEFLDYLAVEGGLSANTILGYGRDLKCFLEHCQSCGINDIVQVDAVLVQDYQRCLSKLGRDESTIKRCLVSIKMFFRYAVMEGLAGDDFTQVLESPKLWQKLPRVCSVDQIMAVIAAPLPEEPYYYRDRAILELLYATGMRASELSKLKISNIKLKIGYLRCFGKGSKERIIPVGKRAIRAVCDYLEHLRPSLANIKSGDFLFVSRTGCPLNRIDVWRLVKKYALRGGMGKRLTVHTLRHCFASHLLAGGADLRSLQEMLGHVDISTTQIYTHVDQGRLRKMHKQFHPRP